MKSYSNTLLTDLYMFTMLQGYFQQRMEEIAVYEFFVRELPANRGFLVAAGLEQVLQYLESLRFSDAELQWLNGTGRFTPEFIDYLSTFRFCGDVHAMPEGTIYFANEPILRITAPIAQAQFAETRVINLLHLETLLTTKASRCVLAAPDKLLVDFGLRRAHGGEAGLLAARASYLAGFTGTSTVLVGKLFDIPIYGTMAHAFIQAHTTEIEAFEHFAWAQPNDVVLLIDTYDTEKATEKVVAIAPRLKERGIAVRAVRLDSGDLAEHARKVRKILDDGGLGEVCIFSSGNLDEYALRDLLDKNAPIDGFGIGTRMDTSSDAPYLDCAYKLVEYAGHPRRKRSEGKVTLPGRKQVFRAYRDNACKTISGDIVTLETDSQPGEPLIRHFLKGGKRVDVAEPLVQSRERLAAQLECLPQHLRNLREEPSYPVGISGALEDLAGQADKEVLQAEAFD